MEPKKRNKVRKVIKKRAAPKQDDTLHLPMTFDEALTSIFKNPKPPKKEEGHGDDKGNC